MIPSGVHPWISLIIHSSKSFTRDFIGEQIRIENYSRIPSGASSRLLWRFVSRSSLEIKSRKSIENFFKYFEQEFLYKFWDEFLQRFPERFIWEFFGKCLQETVVKCSRILSIIYPGIFLGNLRKIWDNGFHWGFL